MSSCAVRSRSSDSPTTVQTANMVLFYILVVVLMSIGTTGRRHCLEGDEPFFNGTFCAYRHADPLDWESAVQLCMLLNSPKILVDTIPSDGRKLMGEFLRDNMLTSVWIAVNQPVPSRPLEYQLLSRDGEFPVHRTGLRLESAGIPWSKEPQTGSCVLLTSDPKSGSLGLRMEDCSRRHSVMCIMSQINETADEFLLAERKKLLAKIEHPDPEPTLDFSYDKKANELFLEADYPERVHPNSPKCYLEGAPLDKNSTIRLLAKTFAAKLLVYTKLDGYISCQARVSGSLQLVRTKRFLRRSSEEEQTFVLAVTYNSRLCRHVMCNPSIDSKFLESATRRIRDKLKTKVQNYLVHAIKVNYWNKENVVITYRVQLPEENVKDLSSTNLAIVSAVTAGGEFKMVTVRSAEFCLAETKDGLTWPETRTGLAAVPQGHCRYSNGVPIARQCSGNFIDGAYWDDPRGWSSGQTCDKSFEREEQIQQLTTRNVSDTQKLKMLQDILASQPRDQLKVAEIRAISEILSNITAEGLSGGDVPKIASITNNVMLLSMNEGASGSLGAAQEQFNTSSSILASLDNMLSRANLASDREMSVESHFATFVMDVDGSQWDNSSTIRGIATRKSSDLQERDIQTLSTTDGLDYIPRPGVVSAVLLPDTLFHDKFSRHRLVFSIFTSSELFGANSSSPYLARHVISVTVNGTRHTLDSPLHLFFKRDYPPGLKNRCVFWNFQANHNKGMWSSEGCKLAEEKITGYDVCICGHLTHFSNLIQTHSSEEEESAALTYVSIIGCSLSILGLCGIFVTAVAMPEWRKGTGKKLQLHFSMAVLMLMCSFLMLAAGGAHHERSALCVVTGVLTHFSLLAVYMWTLAIAWYQYRRLTAPLQALNQIPHYLLITGLAAWGSPFILCCALLTSSIDTYGPPHCYPYGETHFVFVYIPVCSILVANIVIFLLILWSIFECRKCIIHMKSDCQLNNNPMNVHRIKLRLVSSLYLFVLLSLCWVFGFLGWQYLFCITATTQGLSLFLFFVILNKPTRERWRRLVQKGAINLRDLSSS